MLKVLVDFAVLISFGLASPLLAVVVVVKILVQAALTMLLLGRYLDPSGGCVSRLCVCTRYLNSEWAALLLERYPLTG